MKLKRKELLKLPERSWCEKTVYDSIFLIPTGRKHDSGWSLLAIIGCQGQSQPIEIAAYCDDVCWDFSEVENREFALRNDALYPSGIIHFWSWYYVFEVGTSLSSTTIKLKIKNNRGV